MKNGVQEKIRIMLKITGDLSENIFKIRESCKKSAKCISRLNIFANSQEYEAIATTAESFKNTYQFVFENATSVMGLYERVLCNEDLDDESSSKIKGELKKLFSNVLSLYEEMNTLFEYAGYEKTNKEAVQELFVKVVASELPEGHYYFKGSKQWFSRELSKELRKCEEDIASETVAQYKSIYRESIMQHQSVIIKIHIPMCVGSEEFSEMMQ